MLCGRGGSASVGPDPPLPVYDQSARTGSFISSNVFTETLAVPQIRS